VLSHLISSYLVRIAQPEPVVDLDPAAEVELKIAESKIAAEVLADPETISDVEAAVQAEC